MGWQWTRVERRGGEACQIAGIPRGPWNTPPMGLGARNDGDGIRLGRESGMGCQWWSVMGEQPF